MASSEEAPIPVQSPSAQKIHSQSDNEETDVEGEVDEDEQASPNIATDLRGLPYSTLMELDNTVDALNDTVSKAQAEGEKPTPIDSDKHFEALAFPALFQIGKGVVDKPRFYCYAYFSIILLTILTYF